MPWVCSDNSYECEKVSYVYIHRSSLTGILNIFIYVRIRLRVAVIGCDD